MKRHPEGTNMSFKNVIYAAIPLLIVILGSAYLTSGFNAFPSALVAWGTLMLAAATFMLIRHSEKQEQRRREDEQQKRDEDKELNFRRRTLDEIINWVTEVRRAYVPPPGAGPEAFHEWGRRLITAYSSKGDWVEMTANVFGHEFRDNVSNANEVVIAFCNKLREIVEFCEITDVADEAIKEVMAEQIKNVLIATSSVLADALKVKIEYKL